MVRLILTLGVVPWPAVGRIWESAFVATDSGPRSCAHGTVAASARGRQCVGRSRSSVVRQSGRTHSAEWWPMQELSPERAMLVLVRHGQSEWNFANRFIGWYDSPLTEEGEWEADDAGDLLRDHLIEVDEVHTSMLSRTLDTARRALAKMRDAGLQVPADSELRSTWRLNERSYGALTGRNKKECTKEYGKEQLKLWRRSWDVPPPPYEDDCDLYHAETEAFHAKVDSLSAQGLYDPHDDPPPSDLPRGESLMMTQERLVPFWERTLLPSLQQGRRVMVFGHENNLRALVKLLDGISDRDILEVDIPRAMPMVYVFQRERVLEGGAAARLEPVVLRPEDAAEGSQLLSARYLVDSQLIAAFHQRDIMNVYDTDVEENLEEVCVIDEESEGPDMCQTIGEYLHDPGEAMTDRRMVGEPVIIDRRQRKAPADSSSLAFVATFPQPHLWVVATRGRTPTAGSQAFSTSLDCSMRLCTLCVAGGLLLLIARPSRRRHRCDGLQRQGLGNITASVADEEPGAEEDVFAAFGFDDVPEHGDSLDDAATGGAEEEICELLGYDLGETLIRQIGRDFSEAERREAYRESGFERATKAEQPQAIWLIGPSASGKSTLAPSAASWVGVEDGNFVMVDGEAFRDSHRGYQEALMEGKQRGCVWWGAYVGIRENVNKEKQGMLRAAVDASKNLVIPSTCLRKSQCVDVANMLCGRGYLVHIVGMYGQREEIVTRGRRRAMEKGKRYDPREFGIALRQFAPMLRLCNGRYFMVCTTGEDTFAPKCSGSAPLSEEDVQHICREVLLECNAEECEVELDIEGGRDSALPMSS